VGEFEAGTEAAVGEQSRAQAGAEGEGELDALAADGSIALHGGVVGHADGLLPAFFKFFLQRETYPLGVEVGGGVGDAALDDAGKADGDAVEFWEERVELVEALSTARGVGTAGVGTRWRSLMGFPSASRSMALRPEPPTSMERVMGPANLPGIGLANLGFSILRFGSHQEELYSGRAELCGENWTEIGRSGGG